VKRAHRPVVHDREGAAGPEDLGRPRRLTDFGEECRSPKRVLLSTNFLWHRSPDVVIGHMRHKGHCMARFTGRCGDHVRLMVWLNEVMGTSILRMDTAWLSVVPMLQHCEKASNGTDVPNSPAQIRPEPPSA
jgi:hypothetical protein